jgi:predicted transcriptional regulator
MLTKRQPPAQPDVLLKARALSEQGLSSTEISDRLGYSPRAIRNWLSQERQAAPEDASNHIRLLEVENKLRLTQRRLLEMERANLSAELVRREILQLAEHSPAPSEWSVRRSQVGDNTTPIAILSDLHYGEVTDPASLNYINEYNTKIAKQRVKMWVEKVLSNCFDARTNPDFPGLILCLGGDLISGDIHEELEISNEITVPVALLELLDLLVPAIRALKKEFGRILIPATFGNHGRNTRQVRFKRRAFGNFDWLLSGLLERALKDDEGIEFLTPSSTDTYFTIQGRRMLLTHGDTLGAKGGDGFIGPLGPSKRGEGKARRVSESIGLPFEHLIHGHWHTQFVLPRVLANGCVCGYNEYAKDCLRAEPEPPQQILAFIHPDHGVVEYRPILLSTPKSGKVDDRAFDRMKAQFGAKRGRA